MGSVIHKILYRLLPLRGYLRVVSGTLFVLQRLGWGRRSEATEYIFHLKHLVKSGDVAIDIGANLGYYTRTLSRLVGTEGRVYAVEPVPPIFDVLCANTSRLGNVELLNIALGEENRTITMANDTVGAQGYFGTGQNFVAPRDHSEGIEFTAVMQRGSEIFAALTHLDFIKCDIEGYEAVVLHEMLPIIEAHRPVVLLESGGENRPQMIEMFLRMGYTCSTLVRGKELPLVEDNGKDLIFRPIANNEN